MVGIQVLGLDHDKSNHKKQQNKERTASDCVR